MIINNLKAKETLKLFNCYYVVFLYIYILKCMSAKINSRQKELITLLLQQNKILSRH